MLSGLAGYNIVTPSKGDEAPMKLEIGAPHDTPPGDEMADVRGRHSNTPTCLREGMLTDGDNSQR